MGSDKMSDEALGENGSGASVKKQDSKLSPRQVEILSLLQKGKVNKEIARELGIGLGTVKQHVVALFKKLKVTNRAMAASKGFTQDDAERGKTKNKQLARSEEVLMAEAALERRPVTVLSLTPAKAAKKVSQDFQRRLFRTLTDVAFDFGAIFFARHTGGGDMIFGVEQPRVHDVLRAVRAATAAAIAMKTQEGSEMALRGGLSSGIVMASMNRLGAWSGEVIAGAVIGITRELCANAKPGRLALGLPAWQMISFLGAERGGRLLSTVPLTNPFQWRLCGRNLEHPLRGRLAEMKTLMSGLARLADGDGGVIIVEGENGIGKSALLWSFMDRCADYEIAIKMWACPPPDSQPLDNIAGCLIEPGSSKSVALAEFMDRLIKSPAKKPAVIMIDDVHLLPKNAVDDLFLGIKRLAGAPVLFILASRGRANLFSQLLASAVVIELKRLENKFIAEIIADWLGQGAKKKLQIGMMASGVPVFAVELARHLRDNVMAKTVVKGLEAEQELALPLCLLLLVIARVDGFKLDRQLLRLAARNQGEYSRDDLLEGWLGAEDELDLALDKAVKAGLLLRIHTHNGKKETFGFRHPLVQEVMSFSLKDYGRL